MPWNLSYQELFTFPFILDFSLEAHIATQAFVSSADDWPLIGFLISFTAIFHCVLHRLLKAVYTRSSFVSVYCCFVVGFTWMLLINKVKWRVTLFQQNWCPFCCTQENCVDLCTVWVGRTTCSWLNGARLLLRVAKLLQLSANVSNSNCRRKTNSIKAWTLYECH